ncbi:MAG: hypothetical protein ABI666_12360 [Ferruginibacter sp.]
MEHLYTVHTKMIQDKTYYFVKKIMALPELKGLADVVVGYGMHTDFEKACSIAGIDNSECRKQLLLELGERNRPQKAPVEKKRTVEISESVNRWLAERGVEVLN